MLFDILQPCLQPKTTRQKFLLLLQLHLFLPPLSHANFPTHGHDGEDLHMSPILVSQFQVVDLSSPFWSSFIYQFVLVHFFL